MVGPLIPWAWYFLHKYTARPASGVLSIWVFAGTFRSMYCCSPDTKYWQQSLLHWQILKVFNSKRMLFPESIGFLFVVVILAAEIQNVEECCGLSCIGIIKWNGKSNPHPGVKTLTQPPGKTPFLFTSSIETQLKRTVEHRNGSSLLWSFCFWFWARKRSTVRYFLLQINHEKNIVIYNLDSPEPVSGNSTVAVWYIQIRNENNYDLQSRFTWTCFWKLWLFFPRNNLSGHLERRIQLVGCRQKWDTWPPPPCERNADLSLGVTL